MQFLLVFIFLYRGPLANLMSKSIQQQLLSFIENFECGYLAISLNILFTFDF